MGVNDRKQDEKDDKRRSAEDRKKGYERRGQTGFVADWAGVDGGLVVRCAAAISRDGGAIRLGYTRDGGAYAIGIYNGDDRKTVYVAPSEPIEEILREIAEFYEN